jgi:carboxyl-terminal processing protease
MARLRNIVLIFMLSFSMLSCEEFFVEPPANNPEAVFENLWTTFRDEYAPFDEREVNWQSEYDHYRPLVNAHTTDDELFSILSQMLATFDDGHVTLTAPGMSMFISNKIRNEKIDDALFNLAVIRTYLEPGFKEGKENSFIYGKIKNENIAYIYFDFVGENFLELNPFLEKYNGVDGFIIDLRHNQGGDFTYCYSEIGRLIDQPRYVFKSKTKNGKGVNDYTDWHKWYIHPKGKYLDKPIIVLTDRYTISAGERAVMAFKTLPTVTVMGDTTSGAHGTMIGRELANGWFYSLVPQKVEFYDGKSYEGVGLAPDVIIKNSLSEINAGVDKTLQAAIDDLN